MTRRRFTRQRRGWRRWRVPGAGWACGCWLWLQLPDRHPVNLLVCAVLGMAAVPLVLMAAVFGVPYWLALAVPRRWRVAHRHRIDRRTGQPVARGAQDSSKIAAWLHRMVMAADRSRCIYGRHHGEACSGKPQVDHLIPWSLGGITAFPNSAVLCAHHNVIKSNYFADDDTGWTAYRPFRGANRIGEAAAILAAERRARWNVLRYLRAARTLGWVP